MKSNRPLVAASVLAADHLHLEEDLARVENAGSDWHHLDIMDGHFVPNISFGPDFQGFVKKVAKIPLDTHLMLTHPKNFIEKFRKENAAGITIHVECENPVEACLAEIREKGMRPGISLRPGTEAARLSPYLPLVGLVLVMSVEPGFGGQSFMPNALEKISWLKKTREERKLDFLIEVDGGINEETGGLCVRAGADVLVAGTFVYKAKDMRRAISGLKEGLGSC